jgi:predicted GNAT family acetyltransferase
MPHPLDRPLWNALTGRLKAYALGDDHAVRLDPDLGVFLAAADDSAESRASLEALAVRYPGSGLVELEGSAMEAVLPDQPVVSRSPCAQMTCAALAAAKTPDIVFEELGPDDAAEMLALAILTKPGPFRGRTQELGGFIGVKREGRLIAMAGNRLRVEGFTELSGVCVHPDFRGQGLAGALSRIVVARVLESGEQVFLHAYAGHEATIRLYRSLGFDVRARVTYTVLSGEA